MRRALTAAAALALFAAAAARADRRYYAETYSAATAPPGGLDVELWSTLHRAPRDGGLQLWRHQLELETGLTDRWDLALYGVWIREQGDRTRFEALRAESRFRLSAPGEWAVDPVLYLEVKKEFPADAPLAFEGKAILARDQGPWNLSANLVAELELPRGGGNETGWGWALGASYEFHPSLRLGAETWAAFTRVDVPGAPASWERKAFAGPALSLAWSRVWLVLGAGFGLTGASESVLARAIFSVQL
jgi:hypothetical protein